MALEDQELLIPTKGFGTGVDFPPLKASGSHQSVDSCREIQNENPRIAVLGENSKGNGRSKEDGSAHETPEIEGKKGGSWRDLFPAPRAVTPQQPWKYSPPELIKGKRMVAARTTNASGVNWCDNLVVGFFVGKGMSFSAVKIAIEKHWKLKKEVSIRGFGNGAFIFEFLDEEDRAQVLEMGSFYITSKLFTLRPWIPLLEKSVTDIKSVPVWVCIYGVPLHLWDVDGLGLIASYIGKPLLADECTIKKDRLSYARICIEIDIDCEFPNFIPLLVDEEIAFELPVEYQWRPQKYSTCRVFGHETKNCSRIVKARWLPKNKVANPGSEKEVVELQLEQGLHCKDTVGVEDTLQVTKSRVPDSVQNHPNERVRTDGTGNRDNSRIDAETTAAAMPENAPKMARSKGDSLPGKGKTLEGAAIIQPQTSIAGTTATTAGACIAAIDPGASGAAPVSGVTAVRASAGYKAPVIAVGDMGPKVAGVQVGSKPIPAGNLELVKGNSLLLSSDSIVGSALLRNTEASLKGDRLGGQRFESTILADQEGEWTKVKTRSKVPSPKKNPFIMMSDFPYLSKSRFPIDSRKHTNAESVSPSKSRQLEEAKLKKIDKELARLQWEGSPSSARGGTGDFGRGCRSQKK